jgi:hypothetical protein
LDWKLWRATPKKITKKKEKKGTLGTKTSPIQEFPKKKKKKLCLGGKLYLGQGYKNA